MHEVEKVLAYITRESAEGTQLLVFTQPAAPEGGVQVPAGTVDAGERAEDAVLREIFEESGLRIASIERKLAELTRQSPSHVELRHVFHLRAPDATPDAWDHSVTGGGEDNALVFSYQWLPIDVAREQIGWMGEWLAQMEDANAASITE